jgi:hypothetical protein
VQIHDDDHVQTAQSLGLGHEGEQGQEEEQQQQEQQQQKGQEEEEQGPFEADPLPPRKTPPLPAAPAAADVAPFTLSSSESTSSELAADADGAAATEQRFRPMDWRQQSLAARSLHDKDAPSWEALELARKRFRIEPQASADRLGNTGVSTPGTKKVRFVDERDLSGAAETEMESESAERLAATLQRLADVSSPVAPVPVPVPEPALEETAVTETATTTSESLTTGEDVAANVQTDLLESESELGEIGPGGDLSAKQKAKGICSAEKID